MTSPELVRRALKGSDPNVAQAIVALMKVIEAQNKLLGQTVDAVKKLADRIKEIDVRRE